LNRPFKFTTEIYYKYLWDLVPYKIENVRLQYAASNLAQGYAAGVDLKVNGEFIKGTESWVSLSFMQTREKSNGNKYLDAAGNTQKLGFYPRPSDNFMHLSMFLQDYLPNNPSWKIHFMFMFGTGLPVNHPVRGHYEPYYTGNGTPDFYRLPSYRRVDVGISKVLKKEDKTLSEKNPLSVFNEIWVTLEVLNLFDINNTVSYMWLRSVGYQSQNPGWFAVPNYLTPRLFNLKLTFKF